MGEGEPEHAAEPAGRLSSPALAALARWEDAGAQWRVAAMTEERAEVLLCACTGETVDVLEVTDAGALAYLRDHPGGTSR